LKDIEKKINFPETFAQNFEDLKELYFVVKDKIILAEEIADKYLLAPLNEVRNSYDHLFRCFGTDNKTYKSEFESAKRHLKRAGYDACEIIVSYLLIEINDHIKKYDSETISTVCKTYYSDIRPTLLKCQTEYLPDARQKKNHEFPENTENTENKEDLFKEFNELTSKIVAIQDKLIKLTPLFEEYLKEKKDKEEKENRKSKKRFRKGILYGFILSILASAIVAFIIYLMQN